MQPPRKDEILFWDDIEFRVVRQIDEFHVQLENIQSGELERRTTYELYEAYMGGRVKTKNQLRRDVKRGYSAPTLATEEARTNAARDDTRRRIEYIIELERLGVFGKPRKELRKALATIAAQRNESRPPHECTVYRWRQRYEHAQNDVRALFSAIDLRGGRGKGRLGIEVEGMLDDAIDQTYLHNRRADAKDVLDSLCVAIDLVNAKRDPGQHLKLPSIRTVNRRIAQLSSFETSVARFGLREAQRRHAAHGHARFVERILEIVEIDHTPVDLIVTDDDRVACGRPTITVVLDRRSRCVLGYHLSLAGHGVYAVFSALRHAMLPKTYLTKLYADLNLAWPCFGWPERLLADNGREFHADSVRDAMSNLSVLVEFAGSRDPNDKPHVERFLRTFNYNFIHKLPGTTLSNVHERVGYEAEKEACITLSELDRMIHVWICNVYHQRPHRGLDGQAPIDVWTAGAKAFPPQLKMSREDVDIEFSEADTRDLHHYGIEINTFCYASPALTTLRNMLPPKTKVDIKWPHDDAGHIWVWNPIADEYFAVANKDPQYTGLTVAQAKAAKKRKATDPAYQRTNAQAKAINDETVKQAQAEKKLKDRRRAAKQANKTSNELREPRTKPVKASPPPASQRPRAGRPVQVEVPEEV